MRGTQISRWFQYGYCAWRFAESGEPLEELPSDIDKRWDPRCAGERVAHALEKLPKMSAAMARGELSYSKARALTRVANEASEQQAGRTVTYLYDEDGALVLKARLPADVGALLVKALDAALKEIPTPDVPAGTPALPRG